jgi:hypothetical protein
MMNSKISLVLRFAILVEVLAAVSCTKLLDPLDYTRLIRESPRSIVIVPVLNNSHEVAADEIFLATITLPFAERGYYVFPVNLTRELLAEAGLSDAGLVHEAEAQSIGKLFGADAVLFVQINRWEAQYAVLTTTVNVEMIYALRSGKTGESLWESERKLSYQPTTSSSGIAALIEMAIDAAVAKAAPNYVPLARQANHIAVGNIMTNAYGGLQADPTNPYYKMSAGAAAGGQVSSENSNIGRVLLYGPYHPLYRTDDPNAPKVGGAPPPPSNEAHVRQVRRMQTEQKQLEAERAVLKANQDDFDNKLAKCLRLHRRRPDHECWVNLRKEYPDLFTAKLEKARAAKKSGR